MLNNASRAAPSMKQLCDAFPESELLECVSVGATFTNRPHIRSFIERHAASARPANSRAVSWSSLLPHQIEGVNWMRARETDASNAGGILADEMGLGKTVTLLANIHYHEATTNLIVCPASVVGHWLDEIARWMPATSFFHYRSTIEYNRTLCVVSYTTLLNNYPSGWLFQQQWGRVVLDEAHIIRNQKKTFDACLAVLSTRRWALTGTPVQNHPADFDALIAFVCSKQGRGQTSVGRAKKRQRIAENKRNALDPQSLYLRREIAKTVMLPPKYSETVMVDWATDDERDSYRRLFGQVVAHVARRGFQSQVLVYLNNLRFFCSTAIMPHDDITTPEDADGEVDTAFDTRTLSSKARAVLALYATIPATEKVVIFSQWLHMLTVLEQHIPHAVRYDGRMSYDAKAAALASFETNDNVRVILTSLKAGNAGINLSSASRVIMVDPWWNPGVEKQAEDRVYRIGQLRPVFIYHLIMRNSIEQQIDDMKRDKTRHCESFFDNMESVYKHLFENGVNQEIADDDASDDESSDDDSSHFSWPEKGVQDAERAEKG